MLLLLHVQLLHGIVMLSFIAPFFAVMDFLTVLVLLRDVNEQGFVCACASKYNYIAASAFLTSLLTADIAPSARPSML